MNRNKTRELLARHGISAKKSLGQNFLTDANILNRIVSAAQLGPRDGALEIGPGIGALTEKLAQAAGRTVAVEIDGRLLPVLEEVLAPYDNVEVVHGDILKIDLHGLVERHFAGVERLVVVANLPYYITTPILMRLLEEKLPIRRMVVMMQREVAERLDASPGTKDYGSLSIAVQYYCETDIVFGVPRTAFIPQPNVDSAVVSLTLRERPPVSVESEEFFFEVVQASFAQRRKTIFNNLLARYFGKAGKPKGTGGDPNRGKELLLGALQDSGIDPARRGETLTMEEFARLSGVLRKALAGHQSFG